MKNRDKSDTVEPPVGRPGQPRCNDDTVPPPPLPPKQFEIKDSGERQEFESGSVRDSREGKGRFDLMSPLAKLRMAQHYEAGGRKYKDRNWEKGQKLSRYFDSAERHLNSYQEGLREEDHLAAAAWNIWAIIHTEEMIKRGRLPKELDDMPSYLEEE